MFKSIYILILLILFSFPAFAQHETSVLDDSNIRFFIEDLTEKTNGAKANASKDEIKAFLEKHVRDDAYFKSSMKYDIPGFPSQSNTLRLDKEQYIESLVFGQDTAMEDYEGDLKIGKIKISSDKRKATVQITTREMGNMKVSGHGIDEKVPMMGSSSCNQILMLNAQNIIQVYSATCDTSMSFQ